MSEKLEGIVSPSIDKLLAEVPSKYALVMVASKRAREINEYYSALQDGSLRNTVGPVVDAYPEENRLTIALNEVGEHKLAITPAE